MEDTVVVDPGPIPACLVLNPPPVSYAWIRASEDLGVDPDAVIATQAIVLNRHAARRGDDRLPDGRTRVVIVVPGQRADGAQRSAGMVVVAVSRDAALARQIIASASFA